MVELAVRVILGYGPQENDKLEERENFFNELDAEITNCKIANELPFVIGDMNSKLLLNQSKIEPQSPNGKLLLDVITNHEMSILNFSEKCMGKWTHVIRTTGKQSILDYAMSSPDLTPFVEEVIIDEECLFCPFSMKKEKDVFLQQYSDHNPIIIKLKIPHQKKKIPHSYNWQLTKEGLEDFQRLTTNNFDDILPRGDPQHVYNLVEGRISEAMNKCFKRRKIKPMKEIKSTYMEKYKTITRFAKGGRAQRKVAKKYIQEIVKMNLADTAALAHEKVKSTLQQLTIDNKFSPNSFWKLCKKNRPNGTHSTSIETTDGNELFGEEVIANEYLKEFSHRLRKREIIPDLKKYEERTELLCQLCLESSKQKVEPFYSNEEYEKVRKKIQRGKASGRDKIPPEIFIDGGNQLHTLLLSLFNLLKSSDYTVHQWTLVLIATIYKNKGKRKQLINHRGIFLKQIMSKMYEKLNMNRIEPAIRRMDKFQAGNRTDRSTADQTFLLRAAINHCKYVDKPLYIVLYDYTQCFDSLWLSDCILSLWKLGVQTETLNNIYNLNKTCNMVVKTPVGLTDETLIKSIVQQGSVSGGVLCSASTGEVTKENLGRGCQIGCANMKAITFVDDITTLSTEVSDTYTSNDSVQWFSKKKRLSLNIPKCMTMGINLRPSDILPRLKIDKQPIKCVEKTTVLGDSFNSVGSNKDLIDDRATKGKACIISAMSLCNEITLGVYTVETMLLLYKSLFLQVVLYNSQAWCNLTKQEISTLNTVQMKYLKRIFHAPPSTSNPITLLETGNIPIEQEINKRQLNYLHHILRQDKDDPIKMVYDEELKLSHQNNWANEVKMLRKKYEIAETDAEIEDYTKDRWKNIVDRKVKAYAIDMLNKELSCQKHGAKMFLYDQLKAQDYLKTLTPHKARKLFHVRAGILDIKTVRKYWYGDADKNCRLCHQEEEDVDHVVNRCINITRTGTIANILTNNIVDMEAIADRCICFATKVKELNETTIHPRLSRE